MQRFLRIVIPILIFIVIGAYPLDLLISYILKQSNAFPAEYEVMNDIYDGKAETELSIYGSSRAWVHIDPRILEDSTGMKTYNFGNDGHNFPMQYLRHKEILKNLPHPKLILLVIDFYSLYKEDSLYNSKQYLPYMLWNKDIEHYTSAYVAFDPIDYKMPLIRYFGKEAVLWNCINVLIGRDGRNKLRYKGYCGTERTWIYHESEVKEQAQSRIWQTDSNILKMLNQFLDECKQSNTDVIFVYAPEYAAVKKFVPNYQHMLDTIQSIAYAHHLEFLDYSNAAINHNEKYFYNATHLNKTGAEIFSKSLASDVKRYLETKAKLQYNN